MLKSYLHESIGLNIKEEIIDYEDLLHMLVLMCICTFMGECYYLLNIIV